MMMLTGLRHRGRNDDRGAGVTVLLLGLRGVVVEETRRQLHRDDIRILGGSTLEDVRRALRNEPVDHVIIGAGIDLEARLHIVREIFDRSETTTVHLKDRATGPAGFLPFVESVLRGLHPPA